MKTSALQIVTAGALFILLAAIFTPWDRWTTHQPPQESPPAVVPIETPRTPPAQAGEPETRLEERTKPMVVENLGPCACCGGGECCSPTPCLDLSVTIEDTGTGLDGTYTAVWQSTGTPRWTFNTGGCDWEVIAVNSDGGVAYLREVGGTCQLTGTCTQFEGTAKLTIKPTDEECDFCELGSLVGSTIKISWPCWYPEYFELTSFATTNASTCNCDIFEGKEVPINCAASEPFESFAYAVVFSEGCGIPAQVEIGWDCDSEKLSVLASTDSELGSTFYELEDVTLEEFLSDPLTLDRISVGDSNCNWPATITIQGRNPGAWCP